MHINPVKVSFNGFAILFKSLSTHCVLVLFSLQGTNSSNYDNQVLTFVVDLAEYIDSSDNKMLWLPDSEQGIFFLML